MSNKFPSFTHFLYCDLVYSQGGTVLLLIKRMIQFNTRNSILEVYGWI